MPTSPPHLVTKSPCHLVIAALLLLASSTSAQTTSAPKLPLDAAAPEITTTTLEGKPASISSLRTDNKDKILVLQFASITDPLYRSHAAAVEKLAIKESDKATFVLIYQKEFHAADGTGALELNETEGFNLAEPQNLDERTKLARQTVDRLKIKNQTILVDAWSNASSNRYGSYPNMTFIIDAKGILRAGYPFMDTTKVQATISLLALNETLPPELRGPTQRTGPAPFDSAAAAMDMTGGRGPATIATILEHVDMTPEVRLKLFPALADFLSDVQTFRQVRQAVPAAPAPARGAARGPNAPAPAPARGPAAPATPARGPAARGGNQPNMQTDPQMATTPPARPNAPTPAPPARPNAAGAAQPKTVQDLQEAQAALRASSDRLKTIINQSLPKKDATPLFEALNNMIPAQQLF